VHHRMVHGEAARRHRVDAAHDEVARELRRRWRWSTRSRTDYQ
jgi:hypothetical protein